MTTTQQEWVTQDVRSRSTRRAEGRSHRQEVPLDAHAELGSLSRDPVDVLGAQDASRLPNLVALRYSRMLASPFTFYRGAAALMADDLRRRPESGIVTQLCGDAHLSNVGFFASPERALVADLNDFDETAPGPFEWDLKRMAASFELAARARDFDDLTRSGIVGRVVLAYAAAARAASRAPTLELFTARLDVDGLLGELRGRLPQAAVRRSRKAITKMRRRDSAQAAAILSEEVDGMLRLRSEPPLLVPLREITERTGIDPVEARERIAKILEQYRASLSPERRHLLERFRLVDAGIRVVGVGSVGTRAWVALLAGAGRRDVLVLQAKEAQRSVIEPPDRPSAYAHQGERVVRGQRTMQAVGDVLLGWTSGEGIDGIERDFYVRQFRDWKGSAQPDLMEPDTMAVYAEYCGTVLARAHGRGFDPAVISGYVGNGKTLAGALIEFSTAYADQTERDHAALIRATADGRVPALESS